MTKTLVLFYSTWGHIAEMAEAVKKGAEQVPGNTVVIRRVKETLPDEVLGKMGAPKENEENEEKKAAWKRIPVLNLSHEEEVKNGVPTKIYNDKDSDLSQYDSIIFGTPTRYGSIPHQMQAVLDQCGGYWGANALVGKAAGVFVSSATQHGGQETTIRTFHTELLHLGFVIVGLPYSFTGQKGTSVVKGGSPYGASTIAGGHDEDGKFVNRTPSEEDLKGAMYLGRHVSEIGQKLAEIDRKPKQ
eukprot:TRINITY_DN7440_c0_g1_i1.p1 TRINITY_DN7440_c0_g1~~TRINITY_DN7440_c0_g1_i1.p1  ORF type:complete len:244 (-),score=51.05 TRINITY_DN7440_c0_g1_i1:169-900(-)